MCTSNIAAELNLETLDVVKFTTMHPSSSSSSSSPAVLEQRRGERDSE